MTMAVDIGLKSRDSRDDTWSLFATTWQFSKLGTLLRRSRLNLLSWNVGWRQSRGASAWSLHPYSTPSRKDRTVLVRNL